MEEMSSNRAEVRLIASARNWIEGTAVQQLERTATLEGMRLAVGLPDLHPGKGSPIGAAFLTRERIYPALVGNDIGCGIGLWRTDLKGVSKRQAWADRLRQLDGEWDGDTGAFLCERGLAPSGHEASLGTIGSGNHFAELQSVESFSNEEECARLGLDRDVVYLCVHSGSRGYGEQILREHVAEFGARGVAVGSDECATYLERHDHARRWAVANRELIAERLCGRLRTAGVRLLDICHNSVEDVAGDWVHRKGAAPSTEGAVVIPGSRGAFSYVVRPTADGVGDRSGYSLAHGAGRKWSRSDSKGRLEARYRPKDLERTALGSYVICEDRELLYEEAPQAYKNITVVIEDLFNAGLAEVVAILRPLVTYKVRR